MTIRKILIVVSLCLVIVALIFPFNVPIVPEATVTVVDQNGNVMPNVLVKQEWKDVAVEDEIHVSSTRTGPNGIASFPVRKGRSMFLKRLINVVWRTATQGVHASTLPFGLLTAYSNVDPNVWGSVGYNHGTWPSQIELKRRDSPPFNYHP
jgi:hypothetical protein